MIPTQRQLDFLRTYLVSSSLKEAAYQEGVTLAAAKNRLNALYQRLGVHSAIEASIALGWTVLPPETRRCGAMTGRCLMPPGHHGPHVGQVAA